MASRSLGTLTLDIVAQVGGFVQGMDKAERQSAKWRKQVERDLKTVGIAVGAASAAVVTGLAVMVKQSIDAADEASKLAQAAGVTTEAFTGLQFAAGLSGVSTEELSAAFARLNKNAIEAAAGTERQVSVFNALGVSVKDAAGNVRSGDKILSDLADSFAKLPNGADKAAAAMEIFGRAGTKMIPLLNSGAAGIAELTAQAERLGLVISDEQAKASERFNDTLSVLGSVSQGAGNKIAGELLPTLNEMSGLLLDIAEDSDAASTAADAFGVVLKAVSIAGIGLASTFANVGRAIGGLSAAAVAAASLEFEQAGQIIDMMTADNQRATEDAERRISKLLSGDYAEAGEKAAAASGLLRGSTMELAASQREAAKTTKVGTDAITAQLAALELQAATVGMAADQTTLFKLRLDGATESQIAQAQAALNTVSAYAKQAEAIRAMEEAQEQTNREAISILDSLMSEEEQIKQSYERRRQIILDASLLTEQDKNAALLALKEEHDEQMLQVNGSYWERYLAAAEENLQNFDELSGVMLENFTGRFGDAFESMIFDAESLGDAALGMAEGMARSVINALGQMAAQWLAYQAIQLLVGKTTQASAASTMTFNAMASQQMAGLNAFASTAAIPIVGPVMAPAAMTAAIAATSPMVGAVTSLSLAGMAHEGIDAIPQTGTWLLEKGERVTTAETSAKLDKTLSDIQAGKGSGEVNVNFIEDASKAGTVETRREPDGTLTVDGFISNLMGDGKIKQAIGQKFGLAGVGR